MMGEVVLLACSDAREKDDKTEIAELRKIIEGYGLDVSCSSYLYNNLASGREKAEEFNAFILKKGLLAVMDVSGGNVANEMLPYLNYKAIADSPVVFFGYSDLTTIINAIYAKTGKASVLYQARHLVGNEERQREMGELLADIYNSGQDKPDHQAYAICDLTKQAYHFIRGNELKGTVIGGNLRCFLKLAGTGYMPDVADKVLLMEALGGDLMSVRSMLSQLSQLGVFERIKGVIAGTFTALEKQGHYDRFIELLCSYVPENVPIVTTREVGHDRSAKGIWIGKEIEI